MWASDVRVDYGRATVRCLLLLVRSGKRELVSCLLDVVTQLAVGEILALVEGGGEPGVVVVELPAPVHGFGPQPGGPLLAGALGVAGALPRADQHVERLE